MAEEFSTKRIINLPDQSAYVNGDYVATDNATNGTKRFPVSGLVDAAMTGFASVYDATKTYAVGDFCVYGGTVYECTTAITTAEAWTAAHWKATTAGSEIADLKADLTTKVNKSISTVQIPFEITLNKYLDHNGAEITANNYVLLTADVTGMSGYMRIYSRIGNGNSKYAFFDANDVVIAKDTQSGTTAAVIDDVEIPDGAVTLKVTGRTESPRTMPRACRITYENVMLTEQLIPNEFADIEYSWSGGGFAYTNYSFSTSDAIHFMSINVSEGEFYRITGNSYYLYNIIGYANHGVGSITWIPNASNANYFDIVFQIPKGIDCLIVQGDASKTTTIKKATGYANGRIFLGKKIAIIGDSTVEKNSTAVMKWHDNIALETGLEVVNLGVSGTGYKKREEDNKAYYQRLSKIPSDCDAVVIFGSGNDNGQTVGTITDTTTDTVCGCVNKTLNDLIALYPTMKIGVITAYPWRSYKPSKTNAMQTIANDIVEICRGNSIPVLDLYHCSNLRPWIPENESALFANADGVHINDAGHAIVTPMILEFLKTLLSSY